jgi:hypothetical protein
MFDTYDEVVAEWMRSRGRDRRRSGDAAVGVCWTKIAKLSIWLTCGSE